MIQLAVIAAFGAVGAVGRYAISGWVYRALGSSFPFGTLAINLIGCFLLGLIAYLGQNTDWLPPVLRQGLTVGLLGAFTTFSTFSYETLLQLQSGQWQPGLTNIGTNVVAGLVCAWVGILAGRALVG